MAILIIDGMRGSGKTTMCQKLLERFHQDGLDAVVFKGERIEGVSPHEGMILQIEEFDKNPGRIFILDRFHLTEYVMSTYLQRIELGPLLMQTKKLDVALFARGAKCVLLDASYDTIDLRMSAREGTRKLDMPVLNAKNLWAEAQALSRIAKTFPNDTAAQQEAVMHYCIISMAMELEKVS